MTGDNKTSGTLLLTYYFIKYKGDHKRISEAIKSPTDDIDAKVIEKTVDDYRKSKECSKETEFITILHDSYPAALKDKGTEAPFVLQFEAFVETKTGFSPASRSVEEGEKISKHDWIISKFSNMLNHDPMSKESFTGLNHNTVNAVKMFKEHGINIIVPDAADPKLVHMMGNGYKIIFKTFSAEQSYALMAMLCRKLVVTDDTALIIPTVKLFQEKKCGELFAVPGNSGSYRNQLIKQGAHLCDTWKDLLESEVA